MGIAYPVHQPRELYRAIWTHDQVEVIGQQAIGHEADGMAAKSALERCQKGPIIAWTLKKRLSTYAWVRDVKERGGGVSWRLSGHQIGSCTGATSKAGADLDRGPIVRGRATALPDDSNVMSPRGEWRNGLLRLGSAS